VPPLGQHRIQVDFTIGGVRYLPTLQWILDEANLRRARERLVRIKDAFLRHETARVAGGDLAPVTLASHRQLSITSREHRSGPLAAGRALFELV
jgi:hypothetical protein